MPADNGSPGYIHGVDKRMITYHLSQMLLLTVIFIATRTPANVQGARDFSKKGNVKLQSGKNVENITFYSVVLSIKAPNAGCGKRIVLTMFYIILYKFVVVRVVTTIVQNLYFLLIALKLLTILKASIEFLCNWKT